MVAQACLCPPSPPPGCEGSLPSPLPIKALIKIFENVSGRNLNFALEILKEKHLFPDEGGDLVDVQADGHVGQRFYISIRVLTKTRSRD